MRPVTATLVLAVAILAGPAAAVQLRGSVVAVGGAVLSGTGIQSQGTIGQPAVGRSSSGAVVAFHGFWAAGGSRVVGVGDDDPGAPGSPQALAFALASANPARSAVAFGIALPTAARLDLDVIDAQGRRVAALGGSEYAAGTHRLTWDGRDARGGRVGAGVYFARLRVAGRELGTKRIVLTP